MSNINLKNERKNADLTQAELAKILDITVQQYQRLEAGTSDGSIKIWRKLARYFNTTIDDLLKQDDT